ncbi:MAG TPA: hypothetical protein VHA35_15540 [Dongiaceae bacterium]|jgi:hypothetical protein|nr:hypothetical protein [Dongiaceae bacterium]
MPDIPDPAAAAPRRRYAIARRDLVRGGETLLLLPPEPITKEEADRIADEYDALERLTDPASDIRHFPVEYEESMDRPATRDRA